jgi:hypothetical protein
MAVTVTNQSNPIGSRLVNDSDVTSTAADNTTGTTGTLYMVEVDNTANSGIVYFKMADSTDATGGGASGTAATLVLMVPGSTKMSYVFPTGIAFSAGFSHWCVTGAAESDDTSPGNDVIARYVTS